MRISRSEYEELLKCREMLESEYEKKILREGEKTQRKEDNAKREKEREQISKAKEDSKKSYKEFLQSEKRAEKEYAQSMEKAVRNSLGKEKTEDEGTEDEGTGGSCAQSSNQKWIQKIDDSPPAYCPHPIDRRLGGELNREMVSCRACVASLPFLFWPLTFYLFPFPGHTHPPKSPIRRRLVLSIHFLKAFMLPHPIS